MMPTTYGIILGILYILLGAVLGSFVTWRIMLRSTKKGK